MTISLHKLTAGSGYDYLTRQVAVQDATEKGHTSLASYYTEKGETPGLWIGVGMTGIDGLSAGDVVTAEQMLALFGSGHHPLAEVRRAELSDGASDAQVRAVTRLGTPFKVYSSDFSEFRIEVARRLQDVNVAADRASWASIPADERARVRSDVAREFFVREHGREPVDARELAATVAKHSRPRTTTVAGFDLTFSPVKSVSTLWAVADTPIAAMVERAHQAAVKDALTFIESHALFTRTGTNGVRQVDVNGLVAAAFTHRDSRAGDPDLHTHVAVANKVQTTDGRWLAIDGRILYKAKVAASETYNTALERHLTASLGVVFAERPNSDRRKRDVREIVGVNPALNTRWSSRRASIELRRDELAVAFLRDHGRPPSPVEMIALAQQATLETRDPKHEPRSLTEQRTAWRHQAVETLGSERALEQMITEALAPTKSPAPVPDNAWVTAASARVLGAMEEHRSTWQSWHVRAEALRQVRGANLAAADVPTVVDLIVDDVLHTRSVLLTTDSDSINEPEILRRADGSSVYHVAGSEVYTSSRVLAAEQRIVAAAGQIGGRVVDDIVVELALLESAANGTELNAGQAHLVGQLATSGLRVQLAIAPAGSGKTTSMRVLAAAWQESGGTVIGLAPSAAAAAVLGEQTGTPADTLAKLIHDLNTGRAADWMETIGPDTVVVIDEAGMADTLSLDTAIEFVLGRGASVRLVGDDQQLAAIGAGGMLRDIEATHGAVRLSELMRFADPAEGAASLALREGLPEGLGFYLDRGRVHVGDQTTLADEVFTAWETDRTAGLDSIMLAPTRELAAGLNARAQAARLAAVPAAQQPVVRLADGNQASAGDVVITRTNDRRLRVSGTDWVKNGDRWHITNIDRQGDLNVRHVRTGVRVTLPATYVHASTELGYASTVHTAQGVSVDTMHGLATGTESRQQLYTMLTRGRQANHVYVVVTGDGDPHSLIRPETIRPQTATDILETILARDGSARSATTIARDAADPAVLLGQAAARYVDALYAGAESVIGADRTGVIEQTAEQLVPGIVDEPAWPVLRAHLFLIEARGRDAAHDLASVVAERELDGVRDRAAILDWRLDPTGLRGSRPGPLPWLPAISTQLADHPDWGPYLSARASRVDNLTQQVRQQASTGPVPVWARRAASTPAADVLAEVAVWRAATNVPTDDRRPTGAPQLQKAAALWQRHLDEQITGGRNAAMAEWGPLIGQHAPARDPFTTLLAERLATISRSGLDASGLLRAAAAEGPLPDDHAVAALWWRISAHLSPTAATQVDSDRSRLVAGWADALVDTFGQDRAAAITQSPSWPALITQVDHAIGRGWAAADLLDIAAGVEGDDVDPAQSILSRIAIVTDPPPLPENREPSRFEPDLADPDLVDLEQLFPLDEEEPSTLDQSYADTQSGTLAAAMVDRELLGPLEPTDADIDRLLDWADQVDHSPVPRERLLQVNEQALAFYESHYPRSWGQAYVAERLGHDLTGDPRFRPGFAPDSWTALVTHLRGSGFTDAEMVAAGVATTASTGRLIDRFRGRIVFPVMHDGEVLGFVGRRHPDATDSHKAGPKYLNTPETILFHKGAQLFGTADENMTLGSVPVIVEGPMDAIAVTLATGGAYLGVAPLGTSLTDQQTRQLAQFDHDPIVATDGDLPGQVAAERDYWILTLHGFNPRHADLGQGADPASLLADHGPTPLRSALHHAGPLAETLIDERLTNIVDPDQAVRDAAAVIAALPPARWASGIDRIAEHVHAPTHNVEQAVAAAAHQWTSDQRKTTTSHLTNTAAVRTRLEAATQTSPTQMSPTGRWAVLAGELDPRLTSQRDWPVTAQMIQDVHDAGHDVRALAHELVGRDPLTDRPAQDLRYRLVIYLPEDSLTENTVPPPAEDKSRLSSAAREHERTRPMQRPIDGPRR